MRARLLIVSSLLAVSWLVGCSAPPPGAATFRLPTLPVVGLSSATDVEFIGIDERTSALLATGIYRAATERFVPTFLTAAAVPTLALTPFTLDDDACTATITPTGLRTVAFRFFFRDGGAGALLLTNVADLDDVAAGDRVYEFWLAPTAGSVFATCFSERDPAFTLIYELELAAGWNVVANVVTAVTGDGTPTALRYRTEAPIAGTAWRYIELTTTSDTIAWPHRSQRARPDR